jgi:hypothetical protein
MPTAPVLIGALVFLGHDRQFRCLAVVAEMHVRAPTDMPDSRNAMSGVYSFRWR